VRTETFETPGDVRLEIRLGAGEVRVDTADVKETKVVLEPLRNNDASTAAVANARIELRERGGGHEVVIDARDRGRGLFRNAEVLVTVNSPHGTSVESKTGSADITGHGRFGAVEVETGSGDVEFDEIAREVRVNAASGDVQIGVADGIPAFLEVVTITGDVHSTLEGSEEPAQGEPSVALRVNTASGDISLFHA